MIAATLLHIPPIFPPLLFSSQSHMFMFSLSHTLMSTCTCVTLTTVMEAVIVVVVLVVVLQSRGAAGTQLCQSAAGGRELGAEVGHFLTSRLDGPINPLCQVFVVFHHFKDFPLRTKSTQSSMVSSGALDRVKPRPLSPPVIPLSCRPPLPPPPVLPLSQFTLHIYREE